MHPTMLGKGAPGGGGGWCCQAYFVLGRFVNKLSICVDVNVSVCECECVCCRMWS